MMANNNKSEYPRFYKYPKGSYCSVLYGVSSIPVKSYKRTIVCIREGDKIYKIISLSSNKKDESINVFFPYCKYNQAYIFQHKHKYKGGVQKIKKSQIRKEFIVDKKTKLSLHKSGFVQLSGRGILSGIDKETGKPKGIGVFSSPLDKPVISGPTFGFKCWGIDKSFELLKKRRKNIQYIILDKEKDDFTERRFRQYKNKPLNAYWLEFFIFPKEANRFIYDYKGEPFIDHIIPNYLHKPNAIFAHPVIDIKYFNGVICIFPVLIWSQCADELEYGYGLGSPGGSDCIHDKSMTGYNFHLSCPRDFSHDDSLYSLEY
ncbi:MAG: hypothetical protein ABIE43_01010 [Patescibacteria group bacterium]